MANQTQKNCPSGQILRKGYTRKFTSQVKRNGFTVRRKGKLYTVRPTVNAVYIPSSCIEDRGLKGKGPDLIGKLRKGDLIKYGYQYRLSDRMRRIALNKAIKVYGALSVYRKLDAVAKLSVRTAPDASHVFATDRDWIRSHFELKEQK